MRLILLGTGTSFGIPVIGCSCGVCSSSDVRDRRGRHAAVVESGDSERRLLVDTPPELRLQLLAAGIDMIDAVWFTHIHADHTHGVDDLRIFSARRGAALPAFASAGCARSLVRRFGYIFDARAKDVEGTTRPQVHLRRVQAGVPVEAAGFTVLPLPVPHGRATSFGFRIGGLGYITDAKRVPDQIVAALCGVRVLVLNALWFSHTHPGHLNIEEAIQTAERIGAERTLLTHLTHRVRHADLLSQLPQGIEPAHDGQAVPIP